MKSNIFILLFLAIALKACSQNFQGRVFILGEHYLPDQCAVEAIPPSSDLFFYSNDRFVLTNYGNSSDTSRAVGHYSLVRDTITLWFTKFGYDLIVPIDKDLPIRKNITQRMKPEKFIVTKCNGKVILRNYNSKSHSFGSRNERAEAGWMNDVLHHKLYSKILEELNK
jgi:hypothetical protein